MSWSDLSPERLAEITRAGLTKRQLEVYKLHLAGYSRRRIALVLELSESTVREHLDRAEAKLRRPNPRVPLERAA